MAPDTPRSLVQRGLIDAHITRTTDTDHDSKDSSSEIVVHEIRLNEIDPNQRCYQYRLRLSVGDLKESIRTHGQKVPIDLTAHKPHRIIDGFRRYEAIHELLGETVKAIVHRGISDADAHRLAFLKNAVRKNLSIVERGYAIHLARKRGMTTEEIARMCSLSVSQVNRSEQVFNNSPEVVEAVQAGAISIAHARVLISFDLKEELKSWITRAGSGMAAIALRRELQASFGLRAPGRRRRFIRREKTRLRVYGFMVSRSTPKEEIEKAATALQEAFDLLRAWQKQH